MKKIFKGTFLSVATLVLFFGITSSVLAVNSAPVLDASRTPTMSTILEDAGAPVGVVGTPVANLADFVIPAGGLDNVSDADSSPVTGIAVIATDVNFTCYYSTNSGTTWQPMGAVSSSNARLLSATGGTDRVYCQPSPNLNGTFATMLTIRAWDQTSDSDGGLADTTTNGDPTAFSSATDGVSLTVTAVNDAPSATNLSAAESYTLNTPLNLTDIVAGDIDSTNITATLTLSSPSAGTLSTATAGTVTSTYNAGTGVWTASGLLANVNTLLAGVTFTPANGYTGNFTIGTSVSDGIAAAITGSKAMTLGAGPLAVVSVTPTDTATNVAGNTSIVVTFSASMDTSSVTLDSNCVSGCVTYAQTWSAGNSVVTFTPQNSRLLQANTTYTFSIPMAQSASHVALASYDFSFTTAPAATVTSVSAIPSSILAANATYHFTVSESCSILATNIVGPGQAALHISQSPVPNTDLFAYFTGLQVGGTYSTSIQCINSHQVASSTLAIGPFTVIAEAGGISGGSADITWTPQTGTVDHRIAVSGSVSGGVAARTLKQGMSGTDVVSLQQYLNTHGFAIAVSGTGSAGHETPLFGSRTKKAVMSFQKARGMKADGVVGMKTRALMVQ